MGMMVLPHELGFRELLQAARGGSETYSWRAFYGVYGIASGMVITGFGFAAHATTSLATSNQ